MGTEVDQYYLIVSSDDFEHIYPLNSITNFSLDLPSTLTLKGNWEVAVTEIWVKRSERRGQIDLCADFCVESLINNKFTPLLRRIDVKRGYNHILYIKPNYFTVSRSELKHITFYINPVTIDSASFLKGELTVKVHIRRRIPGLF